MHSGHNHDWQPFTWVTNGPWHSTYIHTPMRHCRICFVNESAAEAVLIFQPKDVARREG